MVAPVQSKTSRFMGTLTMHALTARAILLLLFCTIIDFRPCAQQPRPAPTLISRGCPRPARLGCRNHRCRTPSIVPLFILRDAHTGRKTVQSLLPRRCSGPELCGSPVGTFSGYMAGGAKPPSNGSTGRMRRGRTYFVLKQRTQK